MLINLRDKNGKLVIKDILDIDFNMCVAEEAGEYVVQINSTYNYADKYRDTEIDEILKIIKGPDFPTGAMILGTRGIEEAYRTGRGKIRVRAVTEIEAMPNGKLPCYHWEDPAVSFQRKEVQYHTAPCWFRCFPSPFPKGFRSFR